MWVRMNSEDQQLTFGMALDSKIMFIVYYIIVNMLIKAYGLPLARWGPTGSFVGYNYSQMAY